MSIDVQDLFGLHGKTALVTGATSGLGLAMAQAFAGAGARVVVSSNQDAECHAVAAALKGQGAPDAIGVPCDVAVKADVERLAATALAHFGGIDVLVCNAGIEGHSGPLGTASDEQFERVMHVNLRQSLWLTTLFNPSMAARGGGSVIFTASIAGLRGNKGLGLYGASKAALIELARSLAVEWGPKNIRFNAIAPGFVVTPLAANLLKDEAFVARRTQMTPLRRFGEPWEIGALALFLASKASAFITGQVIVADGGTLITDGN